MSKEVLVLPTPEAVAEEAATRWGEIARQAVEERERFSVAVAGGSTPKPLYDLLASDAWRTRIPWGATHVFWGDERRVPPSDPHSNYRMVRDTLLEHVSVPEEQIYRMDGTGLARSAMRDYERKLKRYFNLGRRDLPRFDLILLGMGEDGHTASIFPGTRAVSDLSHMVLAYLVPQLDAERITLTLPVITNARHIIILVTGADKAGTLNAVFNGPVKPSTYPIQAVQPVDGSLTWLVDNAAAEGVSIS